MARVLVIDDEPVVRGFLRTILRGAGHEVDEAEDGAQGLAVLRRQPADLVVCDLFMPNMDGLEVLRELRRDCPDVPFIAMSGGGRDGTIDMLPAAEAFGAVAVLDKPFSVAVVLATVEKALKG